MRITVVACFVFGWLILLHMQKCLWYWSACRGGSNREAEVDGSESDHRFQTCGLKIQTKSFDSWLDPDRWPTLCHEERGFHLHSEADTATRFFGALNVASFAQGLLQEKENVNDIHKWTPYKQKILFNETNSVSRAQESHDPIF